MSNPLQVPRKRRFQFMLTPLVDVMFLLLIFFMLSSQTAPYSLLQILAGAPPGGQTAAPTPPQPLPANPSGRGDLLVSIGHGFVRFNGERVELDGLAQAIERFKGLGFTRAVVLPAKVATVQDVVSVLEAFDRGAFGDTKLMAPQASGE